MCVRVHRSNHVITEPWDPRSRTITIPAQLDPALEDIAIRTVLSELAVEQPDSGAVCWCGAPVRVLHIPQPRQHPEVMARGA